MSEVETFYIGPKFIAFSLFLAAPVILGAVNYVPSLSFAVLLLLFGEFADSLMIYVLLKIMGLQIFLKWKPILC